MVCEVLIVYIRKRYKNDDLLRMLRVGLRQRLAFGVFRARCGNNMHDFRFPPRRRWNCSLLGYYATSSGNLLPTFREKLSVPNSVVKNLDPLTVGPIGCLERSVRNYH